MRICVRLGCPLSPFLFSFVVGLIMQIAKFPYENSGIEICSDKKLCELGYADDVVLLGECWSNLKNFLDRLNECWYFCDVFWTFEL